MVELAALCDGERTRSDCRRFGCGADNRDSGDFRTNADDLTGPEIGAGPIDAGVERAAGELSLGSRDGLERTHKKVERAMGGAAAAAIVRQICVVVSDLSMKRIGKTCVAGRYRVPGRAGSRHDGVNKASVGA